MLPGSSTDLQGEDHPDLNKDQGSDDADLGHGHSEPQKADLGLRSFFSQFTKVTSNEETTERDRVKSIRKDLKKRLDAMVQTDANLYKLFFEALERCHAPSSLWLKLGEYVAKGERLESWQSSASPPFIDYRDFSLAKGVIGLSSDSVLVGTYLSMVLESGQDIFVTVLKFSSFAEGSIERIEALQRSLLRVKIKSKTHFWRLNHFPLPDFVTSYDELQLFIEYLAESSTFSLNEAQRYVEHGMNSSGPYR